MPPKALRVCRKLGCQELTRSSFCEAHKDEEEKRKREMWKRTNANRPSSAKLGYGRRWQRLRKMQLAREPLCRECDGIATQVDHIVPKSEGGTDDQENLQSLCHSCHSRKTAREMRRGPAGGRGVENLPRQGT